MAKQIFSGKDRDESHQVLASYLAAFPQSPAECRETPEGLYEVWDGPEIRESPPASAMPVVEAPMTYLQLRFTDEELKRVAEYLVIALKKEGVI